MPSHKQNLRFYVYFAIISLLLFLRSQRQKTIWIPEDAKDVDSKSQSQIEGSEPTLSGLELEVEKWKTCMKLYLERDSIDWYFIRNGVNQCLNETQFMNVKMTKTWTKVDVQEGVCAYDIFIEPIKKEPFTVVTIGNNTDMESNKKLIEKLPYGSEFFGTHWNTSNIFKDWQKLKNYLKEKTENVINVADYIKTIGNHSIIDLVSINEDVDNYKIFTELSSLGNLEKSKKFICQAKIRLNSPTIEKKPEFVEVINKMISENRYLIFSFHNLEMFLVNYEIPECRE